MFIRYRPLEVVEGFGVCSVGCNAFGVVLHPCSLPGFVRLVA
jgi:hypothetical protein